MIEKAHKHSTVNAENVEIITVEGNLNRSSAKRSSFSKLLFFRAIPRDPVIMMSTVSLKLRTADVYIRFKAHCIFMA